MRIIKKIKKTIKEVLHPSFESLMNEFAIVEDSSAVNEERLEHFRVMVEQRKADEARIKGSGGEETTEGSGQNYSVDNFS
ncbi:MAG: hypothetical protein HDR06_02325 [Lachnospiraceae bacterium]|nr:hypothetical protein [Lachnospiraceae bacterium]